MPLTKKSCVHCQSLIPRKVSLCPSCDRWLDEQGPLATFLQEIIKLRGTLIFLGLLIGFLVWTFHRT